MKQTIYEESRYTGINIYWHYKVQILIISYLSCFISLLATLPGMWERTVTIGSAGKTFSVTGWKVEDSALRHFSAHSDKASQRNMVPRCVFFSKIKSILNRLVKYIYLL